MRKTYMMFLALVFSVLGTTAASAQKIYQAELDKSMFKAWTDHQPGASVVEEPAAIDDGNATFNCESNLFKQLSGGNVVFGNTNVYYLWYADLTGTKTFYAEGTPGLQLRVLMNRPEPIEPGSEGYDAHGGKTLERMLVIGEDGKGSIDVSDLEYVHLNCIKVNWGGSGVVKGFFMEGTVKPVTGILSMISNGDAEGEDLSSFPVSLDGPNNGDTANDKPEIVEGGVDGSKCFKVTAFDSPTETWHTQFYIKSDEVLPNGTKWKLKMSIKADQAAMITSSAQAQPRSWKGDMGLGEIGVSEEWHSYQWSGVIGVDDFQSIAFDLSNENGTPGNAGVSFYFDNIEFGVDLGGSNPMNDISVTAGADVVCVNFNGNTNIANLVKNYGVNTDAGRTFIFDKSCAKVSINGTDQPILSVEGRENGNLYFFMDEDAPAIESEEDVVKVAFTNPSNEECRLLFTNGKWEGQPVPDFSGIDATFDGKLGEGEIYSYMWGAPALEKITPEAGSFNLPATVNSFTVTFNQDVLASSLVAKLGAETLAVSPAEGESKEFTLTRTAETELKGAVELIISAAAGVKGNDLSQDIIVKFSYGPVSEDAQPALIYASNFTGEGEDANGAGWKTTADRASGDDTQTLQEASAGGGSRLQHDQAGYAADVLYLAQRSAVAGIALYGLDDAHKLVLNGGVTYHLTLKSAQWDAYPASGSNRSLRAQILTEEAVDAETGEVLDPDGILAEEFKAVEGRVKENKEFTAFDIAFTPEATGNFVIRLVAGNTEGNPAGYNDGNAIADVKVEYIPDVMGIVETKALNDALEAAKNAYNEILLADEDRYAGEDLTALDNLIKEVEADKASYYLPSVYAAKTEELGAKAKAATEHKAACDSYDAAIKETLDLVAKFADTKFASTQYYKDVVAKAEKYHGTRQEVNVGDDENPIIEINYSFDVLTANDALATANKELSDANLMASKWLTEGPSSKGWNQITTGYAALHERLRRGVELLKSLGVAEDDPLIVQANAELGDNDVIADAIVARANKIILEDLAKGKDSKLFEAPFDEETEEYGDTPSYDLSVFFKNPNCYGPANSTEVPGWTSVKGNCFAWSSWDGAQNHSASTPYPEDCDIHAGWHPNPYAMVEQTVTNLPAGVYVVSVKCNDNGNSWEGGTCAFVRTSGSPVIEEGEDVDRDIHFDLYVTASGDITVKDDEGSDTGEGITIEDGQLGVGFYYNNASQAFFEEITAVKLVAPVEGYDYAKALTSINNTPAAATVRGIQVYDLNGRRMIKAQKGLQIVKKQMSDGTVRVEKVIVK